MKLSNLKTVVYIGLALFYLYIIATNVFRNMEGMTTSIETIENKDGKVKEGAAADGESSGADAKEDAKPSDAKDAKKKKDTKDAKDAKDTTEDAKSSDAKESKDAKKEGITDKNK